MFRRMCIGAFMPEYDPALTLKKLTIRYHSPEGGGVLYATCSMGSKLIQFNVTANRMYDQHMSIDKIIIIVLGAALVALSLVFFEEACAVSAHGSIAITVNGGYTPEVITIQGTKTVDLQAHHPACLRRL